MRTVRTVGSYRFLVWTKGVQAVDVIDALTKHTNTQLTRLDDDFVIGLHRAATSTTVIFGGSKAAVTYDMVPEELASAR